MQRVLPCKRAFTLRKAFACIGLLNFSDACRGLCDVQRALTCRRALTRAESFDLQSYMSRALTSRALTFVRRAEGFAVQRAKYDLQGALTCRGLRRAEGSDVQRAF